MRQQLTHLNKVALLATGDEIIQGDILNSNSQQIALKLTHANIPVGMHAATNDHIDEIEHVIQFLLASHSALIITGGLGPTSDDLTRYGLSKAIHRPLVFDEPSWDSICQRLKRFGYPTPPESNRQQALFPEGSTIIPNPNGTAAGCMVQMQNQFIFMLPGPPDECLPLIDTIVIPMLLEANYQSNLYRKKWLLFGVSEGKIAEELDQITKPFECTTGYRLCYPYLEFKLLSKNKSQLAELIPIVENILKPHLINDSDQIASEQLKERLKTFHGVLTICDLATGGLLEHTLKTPQTVPHLQFSNNAKAPFVELIGLDDFWNNTKEPMTHIKAILHTDKGIKEVSTTVPLRSDRVKLYATEWVCQQILLNLLRS